MPLLPCRLDAALAQLRAEGFEHINMLGRYAFTLPDVVACGGIRPLRGPTLHDDEG